MTLEALCNFHVTGGANLTTEFFVVKGSRSVNFLFVQALSLELAVVAEASHQFTFEKKMFTVRKPNG